MHVRQADAAIGQSVEVGRSDLAAEGAEVGPAQIVRDDEKEVRPLGPAVLVGASKLGGRRHRDSDDADERHQRARRRCHLLFLFVRWALHCPSGSGVIGIR